MFIPTLLGVDLATYSVATSMYECFGLKSYAFGRHRCGISYFSDLIRCEHDENLLVEEVAKDILLRFAKRQKQPCLLIPTTDWYVDLVLRLYDDLAPAFMIAVPDRDIFYEFSKKERFYSALDTYGIAHPKTKTFIVGEYISSDTYPVIIKPSCSHEVASSHFEGQKKVYIAENEESFRAILALLLRHQKGKRYLIQPYLKTKQSFVLTIFAQKNHGVRGAALAEVALEEIGDTSRGNYSALLLRPIDDMARKLITFCDAIGYDGIVNFDIIRTDEGDFVLDMNMRVGRSVDHLRGAGFKVADFLFKSQNRSLPYPEKYISVPVYWRTIADKKVLELCPSHLKEEIKEKIRHGFATSPYTPYARHPSPIERMYHTIHMARATKATARAYKR